MRREKSSKAPRVISSQFPRPTKSRRGTCSTVPLSRENIKFGAENRVVKMAYPGYAKIFKTFEILNQIIPNFEIFER